jgi:hypothetical protein
MNSHIVVSQMRVDQGTSFSAQINRTDEMNQDDLSRSSDQSNRSKALSQTRPQFNVVITISDHVIRILEDNNHAI